MSIFLSKLLKIPGPKDLGKAESNDCLPFDVFGTKPNIYDWNQYHQEIAEKFPIRNFLANTLPSLVKRSFRPIEDVWYYLTCHLLPKQQFHKLDLRQPKYVYENYRGHVRGENGKLIENPEYYNYGYAEIDHRMLYAMFNLLKIYMDSNPTDLEDYYSLDEIEADLSLQKQQQAYREAVGLLYWWQVTRKMDLKKIEDLLDEWINFKKQGNEEEAKKFFDLHIKAEEELEADTEQACIRLIKIRRSLWT